MAVSDLVVRELDDLADMIERQDLDSLSRVLTYVRGRSAEFAVTAHMEKPSPMPVHLDHVRQAEAEALDWLGLPGEQLIAAMIDARALLIGVLPPAARSKMRVLERYHLTYLAEATIDRRRGE